MKQDEIRCRLIDSTIHIIAQEGLDKATTKQIGKHAGINEAYIYRCFADKEDMFARAFDKLDDELLTAAMKHIDVMYNQDMEYEARCRSYFDIIWKLLLEDRDECFAFVRYYYSQYFVIHSAEAHERRYIPLVNKFKDAFKDEADVWMILNHILNVMIDFAIKVHNNHMSGEYGYAEHVFRVIYQSVRQYFRNDTQATYPVCK